MKKELAQKMLDEGLDFLSLDDSLKLLESGTIVQTRFWHVANVEELGGDHQNMTHREIAKTLEDLMGDFALDIGDYNHFDEFTYKLCPAPTYMDLIK